MNGEPISEGQLAELRASYRQTMGTGSAACPGDETLAELVIGELDGDRSRLADHVVSCARCAERYRTLCELHQAAAGRVAHAPRRRPQWRAMLAVAAMLVAALGLYRLLDPAAPGTSPVEPLRAASAPLAVVPADGAVLDVAPESLDWPAQLGAGSYRVHLFDAAAEPVWASDNLSEPRVDLPAAKRAQLRAGNAYFWVVRMSGFTRSRELGPFWFEVGG